MSKSKSKSKLKSKSNTYQNRILKPNRFTFHHQRVREREAQHGHDLDSLVPILSSSSQALREACEEAVGGAEAWFRGCNSGRWTGFFFGGNAKETKAREDVGKKLVEVTEGLKKMLGEWRETERVGLVKPYERFFDVETGRLKENVTKDKVKEMFAARFVPFSCDMTLNLIGVIVACKQIPVHLLCLLLHSRRIRRTPPAPPRHPHRPRLEEAKTTRMDAQRVREARAQDYE
jgi:hypothetical protein